MRIHLPGNGLKGEKQILSCQIGCKAKTPGFPGGCQGPHLPAHTQRESWPASRPGAGGRQPAPAGESAGLSAKAHSLAQGGVAPAVTGRGSSVVW